MAAPHIMDEHRAAHGISGSMSIDTCSSTPVGWGARLRWSCTGSSTGDDGTRITSVKLEVVLSFLDHLSAPPR